MTKKTSKLLAAFLALLLFFSSWPATALTVEAAAKPKLAKSSASIVIGGTSQIKVKNAKGRGKIFYKSNNKNITSVSKKGVVRGVKNGTTKIIVSVKKNAKTTKLTYKVTVRKPALSKKSLSLEAGQSIRLPVRNKPKKAACTWSSDNPSIASVDQKGVVTAQAQGTAAIQATVKTAKKTYTLSCKAAVKTPDTPDPGDTQQDLGRLSSDIAGASVNVSETAIFMLELQNKEIQNSIYLLKDSENIGKMHDDGKDGDAIASDGIYSYQTTCYGEAEITEQYQAICGNSVSNTLDFRYFGVLSEKDLEIQDEYTAAFQKIEESHSSVDGDVDIGAAVQDVYQKALEGKENGDILSASMEENGVLIQFSSGIWYAYQPKQDEIDASGRSVSISVMSLQPYLSEYPENSKRISTEATDGSATKITGQLTNHVFDKNYDDSEVTLDVIKNFSSNQIVLCHTHGYYNTNLGSILWLGEILTPNAKKKYTNDLLSGRIVTTAEKRLGITSGFVLKYLPNLTHSFIYIGSCLSGKDPRLAQSFLNKNAQAVIANSETIYRVYNCNMMRDVVNGLLMYDNAAKQYSTLAEALTYAKSKNGESDYIYYPNKDHPPSTPLIFGDENYRLTGPDDIEVTAVHLDRNSVSIDTGSSITLTATITPSNATDKNVTWHSSDTSVAAVENGSVKGISPGTATIMASTSNGKTASCTVSVTSAATPTVTPTPTPTVTPSPTVTPTITPIPSPTVEPEGITLKLEESSISQYLNSEYPESICITYFTDAPNGISISRRDDSEQTIEIQFTATVSPDNATDKTVIWSSDNSSFATLEDGRVTVKVNSQTPLITITASTVNGKTAKYQIQTCPPELEVDPEPEPEPYPGPRF